jgi:hypothetical protein
MMAAWWLSEAGERLRKEIDTLFPGRDKASDGSKGDSAHATRVSDHNPDPKTGVVRAIDVDEDVWGKAHKDPAAANRLVRQIVEIGKKDARLKYVIFEGHIWSAAHKWVKRTYSGSNPHNGHIHISFDAKGDKDGSPFGLVKALKDEIPALKKADKVKK